MNTALLSVAQTGESLDPVSSSQDEQDACVFCGHDVMNHEPSFKFDKRDAETGELVGGKLEGRFCNECLKVCWR